jgi:hypothetical protein
LVSLISLADIVPHSPDPRDEAKKEKKEKKKKKKEGSACHLRHIEIRGSMRASLRMSVFEMMRLLALGSIPALAQCHQLVCDAATFVERQPVVWVCEGTTTQSAIYRYVLY